MDGWEILARGGAKMNRRQYRWDVLFSKSRFILARDIDYDCSQSSIIQQIRNAAAVLRVPIKIKDMGSHVEVCKKQPTLASTPE